MGLQYLQQRYYDPVAGRFISPDPTGLAAGTNRYAYAQDDPVNGIDPLGLDTLAVFGSNPVPALSWLLYQLSVPQGPLVYGVPGEGETVIQWNSPSKQKVVNWLIAAGPSDSFFFWGHADDDGEIWINDKEQLLLSDLDFINAQRSKRGLPSLRAVDLHGCHTAAWAKTIDSWLRFTRTYYGFPDLTYNPPFAIGHHLKFTRPITYDPYYQYEGARR